MNRTASAKRRALARRQQSGAAMFVVSMMITVLGAVGMFALAAAATEVKTAGNERQSAQTHYLAELGIVAAQREIATKLKSLKSLATNPAYADACMALPLPSYAGSKIAKMCHRLEYPLDFQASYTGWTGPATTSYTVAPYTTGATPGSLGPVPIDPGFALEMTNLQSWMISGNSGTTGYNDSSATGCLVTVSSFGRTLPSFQGASAYGGEGSEMERARIVEQFNDPALCP